MFVLNVEYVSIVQYFCVFVFEFVLLFSVLRFQNSSKQNIPISANSYKKHLTLEHTFVKQSKNDNRTKNGNRKNSLKNMTIENKRFDFNNKIKGDCSCFFIFFLFFMC